MGNLPDVLTFRFAVLNIQAKAMGGGFYRFIYDMSRVNPPVGQDVTIQLVSSQQLTTQYTIGQEIDVTFDQV